MLSTVLKISKRLSLLDFRQYQHAMADWIIERPACGLYTEMGLGKTVAALTAARDLIAIGAVKKVLVLAPLRVAKFTWPAEFAEWEHLDDLSHTVLVGTPAVRELRAKLPTDIHIINDDLLVWLIAYWGKDWPYEMVIIDEASRFKSHKSKKFKALRKVRHKIDRVVELTGTPAANSLLGLWSQVLLLDMGERLGRTYTGFRNAYFISDFHGYNWTPRKGTHDFIYGKLADICMTLKAKDYIDLPDRVSLYNTVEMPKDAQAQYKQIEKHFLAEIGDAEIVAVNAAVKDHQASAIRAGGGLYRRGRRKSHDMGARRKTGRTRNNR